MKIVGVLFCLNEREFIKEQIDCCLLAVDELIILMGAFPFTFFFSTPQGNSIDETKEFIEKYTKDNPKVTFIHSNKWSSFDQMKPRGYALAAERNPDWIWEFCSNEMYLEKDIKEIREKMQNGNFGDGQISVDFRHFFRLLRWSFTMGSECRFFKYKPGRHMINQSTVVESNGQPVSCGGSGITCYHFCPAKTGKHPYMYWLKYIGYHVRGRNGNDVKQEDIDWAYKVLIDEGHLRSLEDIEKEMIGPPYGAHQATPYFGPWPEAIISHPRWHEEVYTYYTIKGYRYNGPIFTKPSL